MASPAFAQAPLLEGIDPVAGYQGQQDIPFTVYGQNFQDGALIFFENPLVVTDGPVTFIDENQLECLIDIDLAATAGPSDVFVINPDFEQGALIDGFEVLPAAPPAPDDCVPGQAYTGTTGLSVTITGDLMFFTTGVDFGPGITVDSIDDITSTSVVCTISIDWTATPGFRTITLDSIWGQGELIDGFEVLQYDAPQILGIDPTESCPNNLGLDIDVSGSNFLEDVDFSFDPGITVNTVTYVGPNFAMINVDVESTAAPGFYTLTVTNPDQQEGALPDAFEVLDCGPHIDSIFPTQGTQGDTGLPVTISGYNFNDLVGVDFGTGVFTNVIASTDAQIDVELDINLLAAPGFRNVTVTTIYGPDVLIGGFEVLPLAPDPPLIDSIDPVQGTQGDIALPVSIFGENLGEINTVDFGSGITVNIESVSEFQVDVTLDIDLTAPIGDHNVYVAGPNGDDTLPNGFFVIGAIPELQWVDPAQGERGQQDLPVQVFGDHLSAVTNVSFGGGIDVAIDSITETQINVTLDIYETATLGPRDVTVTSPNGDSTLPGAFTVILGPPWIDFVIPDQGTQGDTIDVAITGKNFDDTVEVDFGAEITVNSFIIPNQGQINVNLTIEPLAQLGFRDVTVINSEGTDAVLPAGFEVVEAVVTNPILSFIDPVEAYQGTTGLVVTFYGENFVDGLVVDFGHPGIDVTQPVSVTDTSFEVVIDILLTANPGPTDVVVENPDGGNDALIDGFTVLEEISLESIFPTGAYPGDLIDFQASGGGFDSGATLEFFPNPEYFTFIGSVSSSGLIEGSLEIDQFAQPGFYGVRVTNPNMRYAELPSAFQVYEEEPLPPPSVYEIAPDEICIGEQSALVLVSGENFQPGVTAEISFQGFPTDFITGLITTYIDSNTLELMFSVTGNAVEGAYDLLFTNPDMQSASAPPLFIIDCGGVPRMVWEPGTLDIYLEYEGLAGDVLYGSGSAMLMNTGDGDYENIIISITGLTGTDGREIYTDYMDVWPSIVGTLYQDETQEITIEFAMPIDEEFLAMGGGMFYGTMIAEDMVTGDTAECAVSLTIITEGTQVIDIDPLCMQVDLLTPGIPADLLPDDFYSAGEQLTEDVINIIGGCENPYPMFEWATYAGGCPGFMETWYPSYRLSVYPVYPSQSPEEATANPPVWTEYDLDEIYIQYPGTSEPLAGVYMWQIEVLPVPMPGLGVVIDTYEPVYSEIWVFCVEGDFITQPPGEILHGNLNWYPSALDMNSCGMVEADLIISDAIIGHVDGGSPTQLWAEEPGVDIVMVDIDLTALRFNPYNPVPDLGPAAIPFGMNLTPTGYVGYGMGPSDLAFQVYNGGNLLINLPLSSDDGLVEVGIRIGNNEAILPLTIFWPWDADCWEVWAQWWEAHNELEADCTTEWSALENASDALDHAEQVFEEDWEAYLAALSEYLDALNARYDAEDAYEEAVQACSDFFGGSIFSDDVSFSDPGTGGWSYMEAFGGAVGIWFRGDSGAGLLNTFMDMYPDKYSDLFDALREAKQALDDAVQAEGEAESAMNDAENAYNEAADAYNAAADQYESILDSLVACLEYMTYLEELIASLEFWNPDCFGWLPDGSPTTGLGAPGLEGGAQGPPVDLPWPWDDEGGYQPGTETWPGWPFGDDGSGDGTDGIGDCPCDDCEDEWAAVSAAFDKLMEAEEKLAEAQAAFDAAEQALQEAEAELEEAENAYDEKQEAVDELQQKLDEFMSKHVYSNTVGGTPASGQNHAVYRGVDIYFSDAQTMMNIFDIIKPWIDEIADELDAAKEELDQADEELLDAQLKVLDAQVAYDDANNALIEAEVDLIVAQILFDIALDNYLDCLDEAEACYEANAEACGPFIAPHDQEGQGGGPEIGQPGEGGESEPGTSGDDEPSGEGEGESEGEGEGEGESGGDTEPGPEIPGLPSGGGTGQGPTIPPGQPTGPQGTPTGPGQGGGMDDECPCEDCDDEKEAWLAASSAYQNTWETIMRAEGIYYARQTDAYEAGERVNEFQSELDYWNELLGGKSESDPDYEYLTFLRNQVVIALEAAQAELTAAENAVEEAKNNLDMAHEASQAAFELQQQRYVEYMACMERLAACEQENDCEPSASGESGLPPVILPGDPGWPFTPTDPSGSDGQEGPGEPGDGATIPPDFFGPGSDPFDGLIPDDETTWPFPLPGFGEPEGDCPCDTCEWELLQLELAKDMHGEAKEAWDAAWENLVDVAGELADAERELEEAQAESESLANEIANLEDRMAKFMDDHVFVDGVGGDPSAGQNRVNYFGVDIYFSDYEMFMNVFDIIKDGIKSLSERLAAAKAALEARQPAIAAAQAKVDEARQKHDEAEQAESQAWENYLEMLEYYNDMLDQYMECLIERYDCIEAHPVECEGEELEPRSGIINEDADDPVDGNNIVEDLMEDMDSIIEMIEEILEEAESEMDGAQDDAESSSDNYESSWNSADEALREMSGAVDEVAGWWSFFDVMIEDLPVPAYMVHGIATPSEGWISSEVGEFTVCYPPEMEPEIASWITMYSDDIIGLGGYPETDLDLDFGYLDDAIEWFSGAIGELTGRQEEVFVLNDFHAWAEGIMLEREDSISWMDDSLSAIMEKLEPLMEPAE